METYAMNWQINLLRKHCDRGQWNRVRWIQENMYKSRFTVLQDSTVLDSEALNIQIKKGPQRANFKNNL